MSTVVARNGLRRLSPPVRAQQAPSCWAGYEYRFTNYAPIIVSQPGYNGRIRLDAEPEPSSLDEFSLDRFPTIEALKCL